MIEPRMEMFFEENILDINPAIPSPRVKIPSRFICEAEEDSKVRTLERINPIIIREIIMYTEETEIIK